jgi:hypothetical protein
LRRIKMTTAILTWKDPTTRTDGSPISPDIIHINVFDDASPTPNQPIGAVAAGVQTYETAALSAGVHNFTITAVDSEGDTSTVAPCGSVTVPVTLAAPNPPTSGVAVLNP